MTQFWSGYLHNIRSRGRAVSRTPSGSSILHLKLESNEHVDAIDLLSNSKRKRKSTLPRHFPRLQDTE